jgi:hypothetical protein
MPGDTNAAKPEGARGDKPVEQSVDQVLHLPRCARSRRARNGEGIAQKAVPEPGRRLIVVLTGSAPATGGKDPDDDEYTNRSTRFGACSAGGMTVIIMTARFIFSANSGDHLLRADSTASWPRIATERIGPCLVRHLENAPVPGRTMWRTKLTRKTAPTTAGWEQSADSPVDGLCGVVVFPART